MTPASLQSLESEAYKDTFSDGLIDLFIGLSLVGVGIDWLWFQPLPGLAGVIPAVLAVALGPIRRRVLEPRLGYVKWREPRIRRERMQLRLLLVLVIAALLAGNGVIVAIREGDAIADLGVAPGLPAFVLAVGAFVVAATTSVNRLWVYGAVLVAASVTTVIAQANPGGSLLVSGVVISGIGVGLLTRFLRTHPVRDLG